MFWRRWTAAINNEHRARSPIPRRKRRKKVVKERSTLKQARDGENAEGMHEIKVIENLAKTPANGQKLSYAKRGRFFLGTLTGRT